jgi:hypothetical protein
MWQPLSARAMIYFFGLGILAFGSVSGSESSFINFETPTVHPISLSPSGAMLAVCNLPDGRVEFFRTAEQRLELKGSVRVGIDPVSVRFKSENEVWVVNHISQSISVVDVQSFGLISVIQTSPRPTDLVFAGNKAFVAGSLRNTIDVFDSSTYTLLTNIPIRGQRPTAMAVSPDQKTVYCTIKESGNNTTILARKLVPVHEFSKPGAVEDQAGPYGGENPPPNSGSEFTPPTNPKLGTNRPPPVSHIVKKSANGEWLDDNNRNWTEYVKGTNAHLSGRIPGWDMSDHDLATIRTDDLSVSYVDDLMTMCLGIGVDPKSGTIAVVGTEHLNHIRFERNLKSVFARVNVALIDPNSRTSLVKDLNTHLDYKESINRRSACSCLERGRKPFLCCGPWLR